MLVVSTYNNCVYWPVCTANENFGVFSIHYFTLSIFGYFFAVDQSILILDLIYHRWYYTSIVINTQLRKQQRIDSIPVFKVLKHIDVVLLMNSSYASFTKFHPTIPGNLDLCSGSNILLGFHVIKNPTLGTCNPKIPHPAQHTWIMVWPQHL